MITRNPQGLRKVKCGDPLVVIAFPRNKEPKVMEHMEVVKVGKIWLHVADPKYPSLTYRFSIETGRGESDWDAQIAFTSAAQYEEAVALNSAWLKLRHAVDAHWEPPAHLSLDQMLSMTKLIGGTP